MKTNYYTLENLTQPKVKNETKFTHYLDSDRNVDYTNEYPTKWDNCLHIGTDKCYGGVFKCWDDDSPNFTIYFGTKGDEFENGK